MAEPFSGYIPPKDPNGEEATPERRIGIAEQVIEQAEMLAVKIQTNPTASREGIELMIEQLQRITEEMSTHRELIVPQRLLLQRDARQNYALALAYGRVAVEDPEFKEYFEEAVRDIDLDQSLSEALDEPEVETYENDLTVIIKEYRARHGDLDI